MIGHLEAKAVPESLPTPPSGLYYEADKSQAHFAPAQDLAKWTRAHWIDEGGRFHNLAHQHLRFAPIGFQWTNALDKRHGNMTVAQAELLQPPKTWADAARMMLLRSFFGIVPKFLITIYAPHFIDRIEVGDYDSCCAILEHELYHCGQAKGPFGEPKFTKEGTPKWAMRGHDVEEFVGVVERWPVQACAGKTALMIEAAKKAPVFSSHLAETVCCGCGATF